MKKINLLLAFVPMLLMTSCKDKMNPSDMYPDYYSFVAAGVQDSKVVRFTTDDGRTLVPENALSLNLVDNQRVLIYFDLVNKDDKDKTDAQIKLFSINKDVEVGKSVKAADADAVKALGDNGTSINYYPNTPQVTKAYFNIYVGFNAEKPELHEFTLAFDESAKNDSKVLELTLCHNDKGDSSSKEWWTWLSFPVDEFSDLYAGKEKVRINIKTRMNGIQSIELPVPQLDSNELTAFSDNQEGKTAYSVKE